MSFPSPCLLLAAVLHLSAPEGPAAVTRPACPLEAVSGEYGFREALRRRGLTCLQQRYRADFPPADDADGRLRRREEMLAEAAGESDPARRRALLEQARAILQDVLDADPHAPGRLELLLELARDDLERLDPASFDATLLFELPGRDRRRAAALASRATATLGALQREIAGTWAELEQLDEERIARVTGGGMTALLESIQTEASGLQCWAGLFEALAGFSPQAVRPLLEKSLEQAEAVIELPQPPEGRARDHCRRLLAAAVAARLLGRFDQADGCARQVVAVAGRIRSPAERQAVRTLVLVAVLEQLRVLRDAGRSDQLATSLAQVRQWLEKNRPDEAAAWLGVALIESAAVAGPGGATQPARTVAAGNGPDVVWWLQARDIPAPLETFASRSPVWRDGLYAACAGVPALATTEGRSGFGLLLAAGAMLAEAAEDRTPPPVSVIEALAACPPAADLHFLDGERLFLLARACYLSGRRLEAAEALVHLIEQTPGHDRAVPAAREAVALAGQAMAEAGDSASPRVLQTFIRAARGLRGLQPGVPLPAGLQFRLAAAIERSGDPATAEKEYAAVGADDPACLPAVLGRLRCWMTLLQQASAAAAHTDGGTAQELADGAAAAGEEVGAVIALRERIPAERCMAARAMAAQASLWNHPLVGRGGRALEVLDGFESRFDGCDDALGQALRERVRALESLNRLAEARAVVEQYLHRDPAGAGPVMARLLAAMRREIQAALERDEPETVSKLGAEAAELAGKLWAWALAHPESISATERPALLEARGWALRFAGRPAEALEAYDNCRAAVATMPAAEPGWSTILQVGRAECLLDLGRPGEALGLFMDAWRKLPERGEDWWRALTGSLACHLALGTDPKAIEQTVRQQRGLSPELGGQYWRRRLEQIEREAIRRAGGDAGTRPAGG